MSINSGSGGYQIGNGNISEGRLYRGSDPILYELQPFILPEYLNSGLILFTNTSPAGTVYCTAAELDAYFPNSAPGHYFDCCMICIGGANRSLALNSGLTDGGGGVISVTPSTPRTKRFYKTGFNRWTVYGVV